jgi:5-methylcytosine-specific restriction endonuclease McrA
VALHPWSGDKFRKLSLKWLRERSLIVDEHKLKNATLYKMLFEHAKQIPLEIRAELSVKSARDRLIEQDMNTALGNTGRKVRTEREPRRIRRVKASPADFGGSDQEFFRSREWQELRYFVLKKYGAKCQCCGAGRADGKVIHVDHIKPRSRFPLLQWEVNNLQVLCEDCNLGKGAWDRTDWRDKEHE